MRTVISYSVAGRYRSDFSQHSRVFYFSEGAGMLCSVRGGQLIYKWRLYKGSRINSLGMSRGAAKTDDLGQNYMIPDNILL